MHRLILLITMTVAVLGGCSESGVGDIEQIAHHYKELELLTPEPVWANPQLAVMCVAVTDPEFELQEYGPHAFAEINIYMNEPAAAAFRRRSGVYPIGSVVIKEKIGATMAFETDELPFGNGVGGMVKRPPGYDPEHGDWEYFYFEDVSQIESGKIMSCVQCHAGAADRDYVFGDWAQELERGSLK